MHRTTALLTATVIGAALAQPTTASAAAQTCRGVAATIVDSAGGAVEGTNGDDVIVADNASVVRARAGDDLICVTGHTAPYVYASDGNDVVDATGATSGTTTVLDHGDDTYFGSAAYEKVIAGPREGTDSGHDVIATGPPAPREDDVSSGEGGQVNSDDVSGGWMRLEWQGTPTATSRADGGADSTFQMPYPNRSGRLEIDVLAGTLTTAGSGSALGLRGFTAFSVRSDRDLRSFRFRGGSGDESLDVWNTSIRTAFRIALGGGDDRLDVGPFGRRSKFSGGGGTDHIRIGSRTRIDLDLARERLTTGTGRRSLTAEATSFEHTAVASRRVTLSGTKGANTLGVDACRATVHGLAGPDEITTFDSTPGGSPIRCPNGRRMSFLGGAGPDSLVGSNGPDVLLGGRGRDRADGRQGRDACDAEVRRSCEVRR